ncbi:MAG: hypothetical protein KF886_26285 [Candidatus Hydrogenedentes bacterium]|nr:hypothetical protein [Candidatus Hydrogenedentota bacterium]
MRLAGLAVTFLLVADASISAGAIQLADFRVAQRAYNEADITVARDALLMRAGENPADFSAQFEAAECLRITGSELRTRRQTHRLSGREIKALKDEQAAWSEQGLAFAERAAALAKTEEEIAAAHRVYGELYANSITGMVSGLKNGPKARTHMDEALARTPRDPECRRAIGIMYLNNPPFNGGDINNAIETFAECHNLVPDNDVYMVLLAMAYQKNRDWEEALAAVESALAINPANPNAAALKTAIESRTEATE